MKEVYHCTPSQLQEQDAARVLIDLEILIAERGAKNAEAKKANRAARLKGKL